MSGTLHLAALARAHTAFADGTPDADTITVAQRCHPLATASPVALLASFTTYKALVVPLWSGLNRVGLRPPLSDYELLEPGWFESRQWLLTLHDRLAIVVDDRSTNQSCVIAPDEPRIEEVVDRRYEYSDVLPGELFKKPGVKMLDWHGTVSAELEEGSTLFSSYAGFVFGWL